MPRYHSFKLAGDIGLQNDVQTAYRQFGDRILINTKDGTLIDTGPRIWNLSAPRMGIFAE